MKILDGRYYLTMSVPCECLHCEKIGMHLEDGKFGSFLSCDEFPSCTGSISVAVKLKKNEAHTHWITRGKTSEGMTFKPYHHSHKFSPNSDELLSEDKDLANTILANSSCKIEFVKNLNNAPKPTL